MVERYYTLLAQRRWPIVGLSTACLLAALSKRDVLAARLPNAAPRLVLDTGALNTTTALASQPAVRDHFATFFNRHLRRARLLGVRQPFSPACPLPTHRYRQQRNGLSTYP